MGTSVLPSSGSILARTPGASQGMGRSGQPRRVPGQTPPAGQGQQQQPPSSTPGQTFQQMQQSGQARPAPPVSGPTPVSTSTSTPQLSMSPSTSPAPQQSITPPSGPTDQTPYNQANQPTLASGTPSTSQYGTVSPITVQPNYQQYNGPTTSSAGPYNPQGAPLQSQLQGAVSQALQTPSRYNLPQVQQVQSALTNQLQEQFNQQDAQLKEQQAARGLSASTFGGGQMGDLQTNQANALAAMNASLIQNQAATSAQDMSASLGAGQAFSNAGTQANQFGQTLSQQQLENQQQYGLSQQNFGLQQQLGLGNLGLAQSGQNIQQNQFANQLAQQLGISQMQNNTNIYGIQTQGQTNQNNLLYQVMAAMGGLTPAEVQQMMGYYQGQTGSAQTPNQSPSTPPGYQAPSQSPSSQTPNTGVQSPGTTIPNSPSLSYASSGMGGLSPSAMSPSYQNLQGSVASSMGMGGQGSQGGQTPPGGQNSLLSSVANAMGSGGPPTGGVPGSPVPPNPASQGQLGGMTAAGQNPVALGLLPATSPGGGQWNDTMGAYVDASGNPITGGNTDPNAYGNMTSSQIGAKDWGQAQTDATQNLASSRAASGGFYKTPAGQSATALPQTYYDQVNMNDPATQALYKQYLAQAGYSPSGGRMS